MSTKTNKIHYIAAGIAWAIFLISAVFLFAAYPSLPEEIGIHFGPDGEFDIIGGKAWAFYPYAVALISLAVFGALSFAARKVKIKTAAGTKYGIISRELVLFLLDVYKLIFSLFFAGEWAYSVLRQQALHPKAAVVAVDIAFPGLILAAAALIILAILSKKARKAQSNGI